MVFDSSTDDRLAFAQRHYGHCELCEHRCGADRRAGERGPCKAGSTPRLFRHRVEYGEEPELVPSHLLYLSGCDLRCVFCIAEVDAFDPGRGRVLDAEFFNAAVAWGREQGARNLQWVGGEPTIHLPAILELMAQCPALPPVVWKSDFFGTPAAFELLQGTVDVFVADFKFGNDACAKRLSSVDNYLAILKRNLQIAAAGADLIIRHLLMPGHFDCCFRPIVAWLRECLPGAKFSIRDGYLPKWRARRYEDISVPLPAGIGTQARAVALQAGLNLVY